MVKKVLGCFLLLVFLVVLGLWSPWRKWDINFLQLLGIDGQEDFSSLKIRSLAGELDIYIDGELKGSANVADNDFAEITPVTVGEHLVTIKRKAEGAKYFELSRKINFDAGVDVVVAYDLGPSAAFSEGHILYSRRNYDGTDSPKLSISTNPDTVEVFLDGVSVGTAPLKELQLDITKQHKVKLVKPGYDSLEITILPEKQEARDLLKNLTLNLEVNLFAQPIKINTAE